MADLDLDTIPFVPPVEVALIDIKTGRPLTAMHDYMFAQSSWMSQNVVDLKTKITTVIDQVDDVSAQVTQEAIARAEADEALAEQITTVEAKLGEGLAQGEIYFAAKAAPSGYAAAYGLYLKAGNAYAGFEALADSVGGAAIGFTANQFRFTDSGTAQAVFAYSGGAWYFTVPVVIQSGSVGARQVITNENTKIYDSGNVLRVAIGVNI